MGMLSQAVRRPYAPPANGTDASGNSLNQTFLGTADPNLIRVSGDSPTPDDGVQVAQRRPDPSPVQRQQLPVPSRQTLSNPQPGYGDIPQADIENGMSADEKRANRAAALARYARQPFTNAYPLPDDWQRTQPRDLVDDVTRAAQRHDVPIDLLARVLY